MIEKDVHLSENVIELEISIAFLITDHYNPELGIQIDQTVHVE
jgi:hypothetical protein